MTDDLKPCPTCGQRPYAYIGKDGKSVLARDLEDERDRLREALVSAAPKVKPLDFPERRNGYWGHKDGYQVAHTDGDLFRVRFQGRVICRNIRGFDRAVKWANEHHSRRILSMLEGE
jgi:predicted  nucleic acid-binding Zn-ribbon protein